ncbi:MAG: phosphoglycolate phosphatase [Pseudomonadota bacterium]
MTTFLFDLDGTLFDTAPDIADALDLTLTELGLPAAGRERAISWIGGGARVLLKRALPAAGADDADPDDVMPIFMRHYGTTNARTAMPYPGVDDTLSVLAGQGHRLGCVTNKPALFAHQILEASQLLDRFGVLIGGDTLIERKPHPLPLTTAISALEATVDETWMVGDSLTDMDAARAAGVRSAWVPYGYHRDTAQDVLAPTVALQSFAEILDLA